MKRTIWIALGLVASVLCAVTVWARLPSNQINSRGIYIQFDNVYNNLDPAHGFPVAGGHMRWQWKELEPAYDDDYRFENELRPFVSQQASRGKKAALGIETFVGRINQSPPYGSLAVPQWLRTTYSDVAVWNPRGAEPHWYVLDYLSLNYQNKYREFVNALADWLAANPDVAANVAWVEIGVGMYGETQPSDEWVTQNWADYVFYADDPPYGLGYSGSDWVGYVNWCTDVYHNAFRARNPSLSHIVLFLNSAPDFKGTREAFTDYAAEKGVGLKNNGLQVDRHPYYLYEPLIKWGAVTASRDVPIGWETYERWLTNETELYWGLLCALDKLPDVLEPDRWLMVDHSYNPRPNYLAIWNWVEPYLGVTPSTTPGIWCAMRETEFPGNGELGNFDFWLFQRDGMLGGQTVPEWSVTSSKEGRYTRRTDQASGNPYMHFQVLNPSAFYANPGTVTVRVVYRDIGTDSWKLTYDSTTGAKDAGFVYKTNTNSWKEASFVLTDARFGNGYGPGGVGPNPDLKIDCMFDGDEWIHLVEVRKGGVGPTPSASPTPTQTGPATPTPTATATRTATPTRTATRTATATGQPPATATRTASPTRTATTTATPTRTRTPTVTPTAQAIQEVWFQNGVSPHPSYSGIEDTFIVLFAPTVPNGSSHRLELRSDGLTQLLIRIALTEHFSPSSAWGILEAKLYLWLYEANNSFYFDAEAFRVNQHWDEAAATWNSPWLSAGCSAVPDDREGEAAATAKVREVGEGKWVVWDVADLVREWMSGAAANEGLILRGTDGWARTVQFHSSDRFYEPTKHPKLWVRYYELPHGPTPTPTPGPNRPPENVSVWPRSGGRPAEMRVNFFTRYRDLDGWRDLKQVYLHIGDTNNKRNNCRLVYEVRRNRLYLLDNAGSSWIGGYMPGSANVIGNGQCRLNCAKTTVVKSGRVLQVKWNLLFRTSFAGRKRLYMRGTDRSGGAAPWQRKGTWTVQ